jgi:hypothetical protein
LLHQFRAAIIHPMRAARARRGEQQARTSLHFHTARDAVALEQACRGIYYIHHQRVRIEVRFAQVHRGAKRLMPKHAHSPGIKRANQFEVTAQRHGIPPPVR